MLQEPETGIWPGQGGEGAVQAGDQTGRPPHGPGAEAGQAVQGDRDAGDPGQEETNAGDLAQANMRCTLVISGRQCGGNSNAVFLK